MIIEPSRAFITMQRGDRVTARAGYDETVPTFSTAWNFKSEMRLGIRTVKASFNAVGGGSTLISVDVTQIHDPVLETDAFLTAATALRIDWNEPSASPPRSGSVELPVSGSTSFTVDVGAPGSYTVWALPVFAADATRPVVVAGGPVNDVASGVVVS